MYDEFGGTPEKILDQIYQLGEDAKTQYEFLKKVHDLRLFFRDFVHTQYDTPKVSLTIDFNLNKRGENNVEHLVDRVFKPNNDANIEFISEDMSATWYFGEPIEIDFRWAEGDDNTEKPNYDPNDPDIIVEEATARIECVGNWSVLRFLQKYKATDGNTDKLLANQNLMCFKIPLNNGKTAKIYAAITASLPMKPGDASVTTLKLPVPTDDMPKMSDKVVSVSNSPVLVEKASSKYMISDDVDTLSTEDIDEKEDKTDTKKTAPKTPSKNKSDKQTKKTSTKKKTNNTESSNDDEVQEAMDILESDEVPDIANEREQVVQVSEEPIG